MNEQMQKLELEAIAYADSKVPAKDRYNDIYHTIVRGKFAELIIKECASQIRFTDLLKCNDDSDGEILLQASVQLKQHFGVEE